MKNISILAYSKSFFNIKPLLWSLVTEKPNFNFELLIIDFDNISESNNSEKLLSQLNLFRSSFIWKLFKQNENGEQYLNLLKYNSILYLPANCIPFKKALSKLVEDGKYNNSYPICKNPGALLSYCIDKYSSNITEEMIKESTTIDKKEIKYINSKNSIIEELFLISDAEFILPSNEDFLFNYNGKISLVESNNAINS